MTFTISPADRDMGALLWIIIGLLSLVSVILPVLEPYPYIPVDVTVRTCLWLYSVVAQVVLTLV
jgi:hypothetical protein